MQELKDKVQLWDAMIFNRLGLYSASGIFKKNYRLIFFMVVIAVLAYGHDMFSFSMKIDAENHAVTSGAEVAWIAQGRWAMYFLNHTLLPDSVMPLLPTITGLAGLVFGMVFFLSSLAPDRGFADYVSSAVAIASPVISYAFYFVTLGYGIGLMFFLSWCGLYIFTRNPVRNWWFSAIIFAFCLGIYQAAIMIFLSSWFCYLLAQIAIVSGINFRDIVVKNLFYALTLLVSYLIYESISVVCMNLYNMSYDVSYLHGYQNFRMSMDYWSASISETISTATAFYLGSDKYYYYKIKSLSWLFFIALTVIIFRLLIVRQTLQVRLLGVLSLVGLLVSPFILHLFNMGDMPVRSTLAVPVVFAGLVFVACHRMLRLPCCAIGLLVASSVYQFLVVDNKFSLSNQLNWQADRDLSVMVIQRIHGLLHKLSESAPPYPVEIVGELPLLDTSLLIRREAIGASFYHWDAGSATRVTRAWFAMRQLDFRHAFPEEEVKVVERAMAMPVWPAEGSVDLVDGVIVVKFADYPPHRLASICRQEVPNDFCRQMGFR